MSSKEFYAQKSQEFIGKKFGKLVIESIFPLRDKDRIVVLCICDCGNHHKAVLSNLKRGKVQSCGCLNKNGDTHKKATLISAAANFKDRTGEKYHRLTFLYPSKNTKNNRSSWTLQCDCGKIINSNASSVVLGKTKSCGCYNLELAIQRGKDNRKYTPLISSARSIWKGNYSDCDFETFYKLSQEKCFYCGSAPRKTTNIYLWSRKGKIQNPDAIRDGYFNWNGLDRVDSSKGHTIGNIVPCCYICNFMKNELSVNDFLNHIKTVLSYMDKKKDDYIHFPH